MKTLKSILAVLFLATALVSSANAQAIANASDFSGFALNTVSTVAAASPATFTVRGNGFVPSTGGVSFTPLIVGAILNVEAAGGTAEALTILTASCPANSLQNACTFTANSSYAHNAGARLTSGDYGVSGAKAALPLGTPIYVKKRTVAALTSGADLTLTGFIPDQTYLVGCSAVVSITITGPTSWLFGFTGDTDAFGATLGLTAGTRVGFDNYTTVTGTTGLKTSALDVILTRGSGSDFTAGAVQVECTYFTL